MEELSALGTVRIRSAVIDSAPIGPARRTFANAVAVLESDLSPPGLVRARKRLEREFGRRRGRAWRSVNLREQESDQRSKIQGFS